MWKALDRIVSAIICRLFKPKYHVERVERYQLPGRLRIVKWCAAPADAPEDELRRIFSIVDEPQCDDMVVWFYSSLEDIGRKPFDVALLERSGKDTWPTIGSAIVTGAELVTGMILNVWLGLGVWDYSGMPFNYKGQICLPFSILWIFVSIAAVVLDDWLRYWLFGEEHPHYTLFRRGESR